MRPSAPRHHRRIAEVVRVLRESRFAMNGKEIAKAAKLEGPHVDPTIHAAVKAKRITCLRWNGSTLVSTYALTTTEEG